MDDGEVEVDETHPRAINYLGVRRLVRCAERAGARRFVRVTGMSVGYPAFDWIAVLLSVVLSMTIKWQAAGERAIRDACAGSKTMTYCVVRPGSLSDDARCAEDATGKREWCSEAEARACTREDFARGRCGCHRRGASTTRVRGCDYLRGGSGDAERRRARGTLLGSSARDALATVESEKTVKEGRSFRDESMWIDVARDEDELKENRIGGTSPRFSRFSRASSFSSSTGS